MQLEGASPAECRRLSPHPPALSLRRRSQGDVKRPARAVRGTQEETMEGYCVKCRAKTTIKDPVEVTMENGKKAIKGKCAKCGTGVFRILGKGTKK
jgi:hypothetical protein